MSQTMRQVNHLLKIKPPVSRNRNFEEFNHPEGRRLWHLYRIYLSQLKEAREILRDGGGEARLCSENGRHLLKLRRPEMNYTRTSPLPEEVYPLFANLFDRYAPKHK